MDIYERCMVDAFWLNFFIWLGFSLNPHGTEIEKAKFKKILLVSDLFKMSGKIEKSVQNFKN